MLLSSEKTTPLEPDALASVCQQPGQSWVKTIRLDTDALASVHQIQIGKKF